MSNNQMWLPEPLPDPQQGSTADGAGRIEAGASSAGAQPLYDPPAAQEHAARIRPFTSVDRAAMQANPTLGGWDMRSLPRPDGRFNAQPSKQFSVVDALALSWTKFREHLLEWFLFVVTFGVVSVLIAVVMLNSEIATQLSFEERSGPEPVYSLGQALARSFVMDVCYLLFQAMAMQAALQMMRGRLVGFLRFFRIPNPLSVLCLVVVFAAGTTALGQIVVAGPYLALVLIYIACLALAAAIEEDVGPIAALASAFALFFEFPWQAVKLMLTVVVLSGLFAFVPLAGGVLSTAASALMIAYFLRALSGRTTW